MPLRPAAGSAFANTSATSAMPPFVIQCFSPSSTTRSPVSTARDAIAATSLPAVGSVRQKQPTAVPAARRGSHSCRCASVPKSAIVCATSPMCTARKPRTLPSTRPISSWIRAVASAPAPPPPSAVGSGAPRSPALPSLRTSASGNFAARSLSRASGATSARANASALALQTSSTSVSPYRSA